MWTSNRQQSGFTLIELVVVIVILGILAAIALPKFPALQSSARIAIVQGLQGAIVSADALAHSQALANGVDGAATGTIIMEKQTVTIAYGYPDAAATGIGAAISLAGGGYTMTFGANTATFTVTGAATPANCSVTFTEATAVSAPMVVTNTTGC